MKKPMIYILLLIVAIICVSWIIWANSSPVATEYSVTDPDLPEMFDGLRIAQVSDLHNATFGKENHKLLTMLRDARPDIIVITGDIVDSRQTDISVSLAFVKDAVKIAPVYYINGNHESRIAGYSQLKAGMLEAGVLVLENEAVMLERDGEWITLAGLTDPAFETGYLAGDEAAVARKNLKDLTGEGYTILLSHRPELFGVYVEAGANLVFSGHAHGGQFRLPLVGGLYAPGQGFFPQYDAGVFTEGNTVMVVSRGLGNTVAVPRLFNRPEVVIVTLTRT